MADIEYRCTACSAARVVSEFADATKLKCAACGGTLRKAGDMPPPDEDPSVPVSIPRMASAGRLKLATKRADDSAPDSIFVQGEENAVQKPAMSILDSVSGKMLKLHPKIKRKTKGVNQTLWAFLLFGLLGIVTGYIRYGGDVNLLADMPRIPPTVVERLMYFAWAGILGLNLVVVLKALSDNMFQGILCLLVPGWSIYYLLLISDNFYLRAIVFGLLIGIGQDGGRQIYDGVAAGMERISAFIDSGGGEVRRAPAR